MFAANAGDGYGGDGYNVVLVLSGNEKPARKNDVFNWLIKLVWL